MRALTVAFIMLMCAGCVESFSVDYHIYNYNTLQPVELTNVTLYNATAQFSDLTDAAGVAVLDYPGGNGTVLIWRSGYDPYSVAQNISNDSSYTVYLNPSSHSGIIRVTFVDLTFGDHKSCFYFDNGRLEGCHELNDTAVVLHTNMNYTWVPVLDKYDLMATPSGMNKYIYLFFGVSMSAIILLMLFALIVFVFLRLIGWTKR
jgi:hypothetical protein